MKLTDDRHGIWPILGLCKVTCLQRQERLFLQDLHCALMQLSNLKHKINLTMSPEPAKTVHLKRSVYPPLTGYSL